MSSSKSIPPSREGSRRCRVLQEQLLLCRRDTRDRTCSYHSHQKPLETAACSAAENLNGSYGPRGTLTITDKKLRCFSSHSSNKFPSLRPRSLADLGLFLRQDWAPKPKIQPACRTEKAFCLATATAGSSQPSGAVSKAYNILYH